MYSFNLAAPSKRSVTNPHRFRRLVNDAPENITSAIRSFPLDGGNPFRSKTHTLGTANRPGLASEPVDLTFLPLQQGLSKRRSASQRNARSPLPEASNSTKNKTKGAIDSW